MCELLFPDHCDPRLRSRIAARVDALCERIPLSDRERFRDAANFTLAEYAIEPLADILDVISWTRNQKPWSALTATCMLAHDAGYLPKRVPAPEPAGDEAERPADPEAPPPPLPHDDPLSREYRLRIGEAEAVVLSELRRALAASFDPKITDGDVVTLLIQAVAGLLAVQQNLAGVLTDRHVLALLHRMAHAPKIEAMIAEAEIEAEDGGDVDG